MKEKEHSRGSGLLQVDKVGDGDGYRLTGLLFLLGRVLPSRNLDVLLPLTVTTWVVSPCQRTVGDIAQLADFLAGDCVVVQVGGQLAAGVAVEDIR